MPEDDYVWLPREDLLQFEETSALVDVFIGLGVNKVRLTGGEPLMRRDLPELVRLLAAKPGLTDLALTTNGVLLADQIDALGAAGIGRITVSLDTLRRDRFEKLTRFDRLDAVREGIAAAANIFKARGAPPPRAEDLSLERRLSASGVAGAPHALKLDSVIIRGVNDDELIELLEYGRSVNAEVRFIEYMDVGGATRWSQADVVSRAEMVNRLARHYGRLEPLTEESSAPADRFLLPDGTTFGIISSTTDPFCQRCDRSRLTADGLWYLCLYAAQGVDLRGPLRRGASADEIATTVAEGWRGRIDRGAEERLALGNRRIVPLRDLRKDPHLEMHTRGG
jgi:cyclic pyranopterin phosphate synthase